MSQAEQVLVISNMTVGDFKRFQKALKVLMSANLNQMSAVEILSSAHKDRQVNKGR